MEPRDNPLNQTFGSALRHHRVTAGMTQEQLSERSGISVRGISDLERGARRSPRRETVKLLAHALELTSEEWSALLLASRRESTRRGQGKEVEPPSHRTRQVPEPVDAFVGRTAEIAGITQLLSMSGARLVTITGPGGVGKSRLGMEVARKVAGSFNRNVAFAPLTSVTEPGDVLTAIAQAIGVPPGDETTLQAGLVASLPGRPFLLVIDNFEHLLPAATVLTELLEMCPELHILVTSRARLSISGEHRFDLTPMTVPDQVRSGAVLSVDEVLAVDSVRLFVVRAKAANSAFELTSANTEAVAGICRQLEGLPLAIELAAARVSLLDPRALLQTLHSRLSVLTAGERNQPPRLRTMRNAIQWSYGLLSAEHQQLFRSLAVFNGGFGLDGATALDVDAGKDRDLLGGIAFLVDQSLLQSRPQEDGTARFQMLETIREFALEQLERSDEHGFVRNRHADIFASLAEGLRPHFEGPKGSWALAQLEIERGNLQDAISWFIAQKDADGALRMGDALWKFWFIHWHLREGLDCLARALALPGSRSSLHFAEALYGAGVFARDIGRRSEAGQYGEQLLARSVEDHDLLHEAMGHFLLGTLASRDRDSALAAERYELALDRFRKLDHEHGIAMMLHQLATAARELGDLDSAETRDIEALAIWRQREDVWGSALALTGLALTAEDRSQPGRAAEYFLATMDLNARAGDPGNVVRGVEGIARLAAGGQQPGLALQLFAAAEAISGAIGRSPHPVDRTRNETAARSARAKLGTTASESAWASGRLLTLDQATALAETRYRSGSKTRPPRSVGPPLSPRELEVLRLVVTGRTDREIGDVLFISHRTVTSHVTSILNKLGVSSRTAAAAIGVRSGLV